MSERRKFVRLDIAVNVKLSRLSVQRLAESDDCSTRNLCRGGICVTTKKIFKTGDVVDLDIKLPVDQPVHASGRVTWVKRLGGLRPTGNDPYDVGIEFVGIAPDQQDALNRFIYEAITIKRNI